MSVVEEPSGRRAIGLIINPIAGMGGAVGLKGTDGLDRLSRAVGRGARPRAGARARDALARLCGLRDRILVLAAPGEMGAEAARALGLETRTVGDRSGWIFETTSADTSEAALALERDGAELILFAGGDGTARDLAAALGCRVPVIGIPTGVKMYSGVFARNPAAAGDAAMAFIAAGSDARVDDADVVDRADDGQLVLHGALRVPRQPHRILGPKDAVTGAGDVPLEGACREIVESMEAGRLYVLGPGTTAGRIRAALGFSSDPLAVDVVRDKHAVALDVNEGRLDELVREARGRVSVIVGVIGGQGSLLGRGNQEISPRVLGQISPDDLIIVASRAKLTALDPPRLIVDTGDAEIDTRLAGHRRIRVGRREDLVFEVAS